MFWCVIALVAVGLAFTLNFYFSEEARLRRRRRKSHGRIISKTPRAIVKFNVRPPKEK